MITTHRKRKILYRTRCICDLQIEISLTYCGKLIIDAAWFGEAGNSGIILYSEQTVEFNQRTKWDDERAVKLYTHASN